MYIKITKALNGPDDSKFVWARRTLVYAAHTAIQENDRMRLWRQNVRVVDDAKTLSKIVKRRRESQGQAQSNSAGESSILEDEEFEVNGGGEADKIDTRSPEKKRMKPSEGHAFLVKSGDTKKLISDRRLELERMEALKITVTEAYETEKLKLQVIVHKISMAWLHYSDQVQAKEKLNALEASVIARVAKLESARAILVLAFDGFPHEKSAGPVSFIGPHNGRDAAAAIAWTERNPKLDTSTLSSEEKKITFQSLLKHLSSVTNESAFMMQMLLAAKVVVHVSSSLHKRLLNLCFSWISTYLPHCLAKVNRFVVNQHI